MINSAGPYAALITEELSKGKALTSVELAKVTGVQRAAITRVLRRFSSQGLITAEPVPGRTGGNQPINRYKLVPAEQRAPTPEPAKPQSIPQPDVSHLRYFDAVAFDEFVAAYSLFLMGRRTQQDVLAKVNVLISRFPT